MGLGLVIEVKRPGEEVQGAVEIGADAEFLHPLLRRRAGVVALLEVVHQAGAVRAALVNRAGEPILRVRRGAVAVFAIHFPDGRVHGLVVVVAPVEVGIVVAGEGVDAVVAVLVVDLQRGEVLFHFVGGGEIVIHFAHIRGLQGAFRCIHREAQRAEPGRHAFRSRSRRPGARRHEAEQVAADGAADMGHAGHGPAAVGEAAEDAVRIMRAVVVGAAHAVVALLEALQRQVDIRIADVHGGG